MNYFMVQFGYEGPHSNLAVGGDANAACFVASDEAETLLRGIPGIKVAHAYGWPDGSCYKYVCGDMTAEELQREAHKRLKGILYSVLVNPQDSEKNPWKSGHKTLREYMEKAAT
jgi:hypothetical protein